MLVGISPLLSPELLATLCRMGHGDEIVFADAHFPGESLGPAVIRADGLRIAPLLEGVLPLMALDDYVDDPVVMMAPVAGDQPDPLVEASYQKVINQHWPDTPAVVHIERFAFYERAKAAFSVVMTGELAKYGNIILKKGVSPV